MKYVIKNVGQSRQYTITDKSTGAQVPLISYAIMINDNGQDIWCEMSTKPDKPAPKTGEELDGTIQYMTNGYPHKFKKTATSGGFSKGGYKTSPEVQASIIRQNALTNAVTYICSKVNPNQPVEVADIIKIASEFYLFSSGKMEIKPVATHDIQQSPPFQPQAFPDDKIDGSDLMVSDLPF